MSNDIVVSREFGIINPDKAAAIFAGLGGMTNDFDRIKTPAAGGLTWEIPSEDDNNPDYQKELVGVIVHHHLSSRLYLDDQDTSGSGRPDAWSNDGVVQHVPLETVQKCKDRGLPVPLEHLADCPYNEWGSARLLGKAGNGKATRGYREIYILPENSLLPYQLSITSTSDKNFTSWLLKRVAGNARELTDVVAKITLRRAESKNGIAYSQPVFQTDFVLDAETAAALKQYSVGLQAIAGVDRYAEFNKSVGDRGAVEASGYDANGVPNSLDSQSVNNVVDQAVSATSVVDSGGDLPDI